MQDVDYAETILALPANSKCLFQNNVYNGTSSVVLCGEFHTSCWNRKNIFWFGVCSWLRSSLIPFHTSLQCYPFIVTALSLLSINQYGTSIPFFVFNAHRAAIFGLFKNLLSIIIDYNYHYHYQFNDYYRLLR